MRDFDVTRMSDYSLSVDYFDMLDRLGKNNEDVEAMRNELEERDRLFEGYLICDWTSQFTVNGCREAFSVLEDLKDYISSRGDIEPNEAGAMVYSD